MRKLFFIALVALCASFPGEVCAEIATPNYSVSQPQSDIDAATLERIFEAVSCETGACIHEVREMYANDQLVIEKDGGDSYAVTLYNTDGGIMDIVIADNL